MTKVFTSIKSTPEHSKKAAPSNPKRDHSKYRTKKIGRTQRKARAFKKIELALK